MLVYQPQVSKWIDNQLEFPKKPEVEAYYKSHIDKYQRKAGVKIRVIRIDLSVEDKLTGVRKPRENPYGMLEDIQPRVDAPAPRNSLRSIDCIRSSMAQLLLSPVASQI